jgi:hypothetical protein
MGQYAVTLSDGREIIFEESSEDAAVQAAQRWERLNPAGQDIGLYEVELENGDVKRIPAVSEDAARDFASAWGPQQRALEDARKRSQSTPGQVRAAAHGITLGGASILDAGSAALETGANNLIARLTGGDDVGYGMADAFNAVRESESDARRSFAEENPLVALGYGIVGSVAATGATGGGNLIAQALKNSNLGGRILGSAVTGASAGGVEGLLSSRPGEEARSTNEGLAVGGIVGAAAPVVSSGVGSTGRTLARGVNRLSGGRLLNPNREAGKRLVEAMRRDNMSPESIREATNEWMRSGASSPALLDIVAQNGGGQNTLALLRAAGSRAGAGRNEAVQYTNQIQADLQDNIINRTRQLTPDQRPAQQVIDSLESQRSADAASQYAEPYAQRVALDNDTISALSGAPGRAALNRAYAAAEARRDVQQMQEINDLLNGSNEVSAGTLDRIRIAMANRGEAMQRDPRNRDIAGGLFNRAGSIDEALAEPLAQPRANYRDLSQQIDAVNFGQGALRESPDMVAAQIDQMTPPAREAAGIGLRQNIIDNVGAPTEGATGYVNRLATGTNPRRILGDVFGEEEAARYQQALRNEVSRLGNARFINPNTGSQTASRLVDQVETLRNPPTSPVGIALALIDKVRRGATLTEQERGAILRMGTAQASAFSAPTQRSPQVGNAVIPLLAGINQF